MKIAATATNESWKPGSSRLYGTPGEQHERAEQEEPPAVALPRADPGERRERSRDTCAHDGRLGADREHVGPDCCERAHLARHARDPEQPRHEEHAARDESDVLAGHGEQVVEPRGAERVPQAYGRALRPRRARSRAARHAARRRLPTRARLPMPDRSRSATPPRPPRRPTISGARPFRTTWTPWRRSHVRSSKPSSELPRLGDEHRQPEHRSLRRRTADGQLEQDRLADVAAGEALDARREDGSHTACGAQARSRPRERRRHARSPPVSGLRSIASIRSEPHHQPPSASPSASSANRARGTAAATTAARTASAGTASAPLR